MEAGKPAVVESVLGHGAQVHIRGMQRLRKYHKKNRGINYYIKLWLLLG